jgi:hypothetical protein
MADGTGDWRHEWLSGRRLLAGIAILLLLAACISDFTSGSFWSRHAMLTSIAASILVVFVSASVVEVVLDRRAEMRWRLLAQYALFDLADNANLTWTALMKKLEVPESAGLVADQVHRYLDSEESIAEVRTFLESALSDPVRRASILKLFEHLLGLNQELITRWSVVMTGSRSYVVLFDRHVELFTRVSTIQYYMRTDSPRGVQYWSTTTEEPEKLLVDLVISVFHVAVDLEVATWALALKIAGREWWDQRTGQLTSAHDSSMS